jgi:MFS family permease
MCLCLLACAFAFQGIPPVLSLILKEFNLSHYQGGLLMSMFALPAIIISLPAGVLADRYGTKPVAAVALLLVTVGSVLVATANSYPALIVGRIITGLGGISLLVVTPQGIGAAFRPREMGLAMGVFNTTGPVGIIVSLNCFAALAAHYGWRSPVWVTASFSAMMFTLLLLFYHPATDQTRPQRTEEGKKRFRLPPGTLTLWLIALSWAFFNGSFVSLFSFCPDFLVSRGHTLESAGFYTSIVVMASLVFAPISGYVTDRTRRKELIIVLGGLCMAVSLLLIPGYMAMIVIFMTIIGATSAFIGTPVYALATEAVPRESLGLAFGVLSMFNNLGVFIVPQLVGYSRDVTGAYEKGFMLMALFASLIALTAALTLPFRKLPALPFARSVRPKTEVSTTGE